MKTATRNSTGINDDASRRKVSVSSCIEMALARLPNLMSQVIDGLRQASGLLPGVPAQSAVFRTDVRPAVQQLINQRESLKTSFAGQVRVLAFGGGTNLGNKPLVRFEDIQLLDVNQLDESIELARVQQELDYAVTDQIERFHALMSSVMGWISVQPGLNPLRTELFAKALRDTLAAHIAVPEVRSEILAAAAGRLGQGLRNIYRDISDSLVSRGVEPAGLVTPTRGSVTAPGATDKPGETTRSILTLERLRRLFSPEVGADALASVHSGNDFLHTVPASVQALQDMRQVEAMIQRLEARKQQQAAQPGNAAAQSLDMLRKPLDGRQLGEQIGQEVTRMMLENLVQDDRLLPQVRRVLGNLNAVLMTLAKADVRFFSDHKHPARQFLDRVTDRSLAFTGEDNDGYGRFIQSIDAAVKGIVESHSPKAFAFAKQLETLLAIWQHEDKLQMQLREETARALLHVEQRNLLAQRLIEEWLGKLADKPVPPLVRGFLLGPWAQVVAESQLSTNRASADAQGYEPLVDELIWSTQPRQARRNPARLVQMIPGMLSTLRSGLQMIAYPPDRISQFFNELIACHESVLQEARALREKMEASREASKREDTAAQLQEMFDDTPAVENRPTEPMPLQAPWLVGGETSDAGYLEADAVMPIDPTAPDATQEDQEDAHNTSETLSEGAWVEMMLDGEWTRLKLTWSSPHRTLFMFTSTRGRAHSMSRRSMERLLASGMIRIVSAGLMLDDALDAVARAALRNSVEANQQESAAQRGAHA